MTQATRQAALAGLLLCATLAGDSLRAARADSPSGSGTSCVVSGDAMVDKDTTIHSAASGGYPIAKFTGAIAPLKATNFPANVSTGRVQVNTGAGFRVEGFTDPKSMRIFGNREIPVVHSHLWLSSAVPLKIVGASPGKLKVELPARGKLSRATQTTTRCDALTFTKGTVPTYDVPGNARGYVARSGSLDLYDTPGGEVIHSLQTTGAAGGLLLWGTKVRRGYVSVASRYGVLIDAWVRIRDVRALPRGETMDQLLPPDRYQNPPKLALKDHTGVMRVSKEVKLHYGRGEATPIIGVIEAGAEIYKMETVIGWTSVLPKKLHVLPHGDRAFWVKGSELAGASSP